ncbi:MULTISPECIES: hypothetical protein [unclassified Cupriavidus]|uniref:hypothetical protein n=1 Tax=unclassified Cupriavidus TaxID=2640874 RepID=UPI00226E335E|nr:hypothetical protein [Cupriavidus sp. D39]MCY0853687.1 hypothetical protein [Cupriavidus sp. D39]
MTINVAISPGSATVGTASIVVHGEHPLDAENAINRILMIKGCSRSQAEKSPR